MVTFIEEELGTFELQAGIVAHLISATKCTTTNQKYRISCSGLPTLKAEWQCCFLSQMK